MNGLKIEILSFFTAVILYTVTSEKKYLAGSEDLEHERQAMCDKLLCVLLFLNAAEFL